MNKTILVTGGTGFLGSRLVSQLVAEDYRVILLKRSHSDLRRIQNVFPRIVSYDLDKTALRDVFEHHRIDLVAHCATDYGRKNVPANAVIEANLVLPLKLLELAKETGVRAFINTDTILDKRISHYSLSKKQFSEWLEMFATDFVGINFALEHFFGPGDDNSKFVSKMVQSAIQQVDKIDLTPGEQKRDFIFIDDVIDAFMRVIRHSEKLERGVHRYEVGSNQSMRLKDFMALLMRVAGNQKTVLNWGALPYRPNEVMESIVDTSGLEALGWKPRVSLEDGVRRTLEHIKKEILVECAT